jgi:hypothetical protein
VKKVFTYLLLMIFVFQSVSQLWILGAFYVRRDYIANNVCVNRFDAVPICKGQCYLTQELTEHGQEQEQQLPDLKHKGLELLAVSETPCYLEPPVHQYSLPVPSAGTGHLSSGFLFSVFHPPRLA